MYFVYRSLLKTSITADAFYLFKKKEKKECVKIFLTVLSALDFITVRPQQTPSDLFIHGPYTGSLGICHRKDLVADIER